MGEGWKGKRFELGRAGEFLAVGRKGWLYWKIGQHLDVRLHIAEAFGELVIDALSISAEGTIFGAGAISPTILKELRLGSIQVFINSDPCAREIKHSFCAEDGPDFDPATVDRPSGELTFDSIPLVIGDRSLLLDIPSGINKKYPDEFYQQVLEVFSSQRQISRSPAADIARYNRVEKTTVHRWVKEARRRARGPFRAEVSPSAP